MVSENPAHLCANCTAMTTDFSNTPQYVRISQAQFAHITVYYSIDTECYNIETNHDKVQTEPVDRFREPILLTYFIEPTKPLAYIGLRISGMGTIKKKR